MDTVPPFQPHAFLAGCGEAGDLIARRDWSATALGPIGAWPQSLRTALGLVLRSPVPIVLLWGPEGVMLYNDAYSAFAGGRHPELLGSEVREGWPEVADFNDNVMRVGLAGGTLSYRDQELTLYRHGRPEQVFMDLSYSPVPGEDGRPAGVVAVVVETTARVLAERRQAFLVELGDSLRDVVGPNAITVTAAALLGRHLGVGRAGYGDIVGNGEVVRVDRDWTCGAMASLAGEARVLDAFGPAVIAELRAGRTLVVEDCRADPRTADPEHLASWDGIGTRALVVVPLVRGDALVSVLYAHNAAPRRWAPLEVQLCEDVAARTWTAVERDRAERALREAEGLHRASLETQVAESTLERDRMWRLSRDMLAVFNTEGVLLRASPAWETVLGLSPAEIEGRHHTALKHRDDWNRGEEAIAFLAAGNTLTSFEDRYIHKDGSLRWISWTAAPEGRLVFAVGRDVTELKRAQEQLRHAQKMDAVGQLTGGVAHDFNNLLQALGGCLTMIARRAPEPKVQGLVEAGQQAVDRGAKLVQQLMAFSRREGLRTEPVDLRDRILGMQALMERALRADIRLETRLAPGLWPVEVDPTQLELALLNMATNARDAMPGGGTLVVSARNETIGPENPTGLEGEFVRLEVADTGAGMTPEVLARVFEPFFTTKEVGKGSGLGLAQVYGLARQCGGTATVESTPGQGTTVALLLRRSALAPSQSVRAGPTAAAAQRGGRVLMVEDEPLVASTVTAALQEAGYEVARVATAEEAMPLLEGKAQIDLLFTDVVTPGRLSGIDLAREARRLRPGMPVLVTTGYSEDVAKADGARVLPKPYTVSDLLGAIAEGMAGGA